LEGDARVLTGIKNDLLPFLANTYHHVIQTTLSVIQSYQNYVLTGKQALEILAHITPPRSSRRVSDGSRPEKPRAVRATRPVQPPDGLYRESRDTQAFMDGR